MKIKYVANNGAVFNTEKECLEYEKRISKKYNYEVEIYYSGYFYTNVNATSEEEALQLARKEVDFDDICFEETGGSVIKKEDCYL